jgi:hypothetical protein
MKKNLDPAVLAFFQDIGHKSGSKLRDERGSEYFSRISRLRKHPGRKKKA